MSETTPGREPIQIVEIIQKSCILDYGTSPCTASVGVTGDRKCFNTDKTCQDRQNLNLSGTIAWRFTKPSADRPDDLYDSTGNDLELNPIPSLASVSTTPTKINPGGGNRNAKALGNRASAVVVLGDHKYDDSGSDKYLSERDYVATDRGTFWGKWLARNPYYNGLTLNIYEGYRGQLLTAMQKRTYLIEKIDGPDYSGRVTITARDPLRLSDDQRALCPSPVQINLKSALNSINTGSIIFIGVGSEINTAEGDQSASVYYARINDEIISYTGSTEGDPGEWTLSGVVRGVLGTTAAEHDADSQITRVARWDSVPQWQAIRNMLDDYTPVPMSYINDAEWESEWLDFLATYSITGTVAEPTPVIDLISELCEQSLSYVYWDDRNQLIKFKALRPPQETPKFIDDTANIIADSVQIRVDPTQRLSRIVVYYLERDPTQREDIGNYARIEVRVDGTAEQQYDETRTRRIFSRWLTTQAQAQDLTVRMLSRYRDNPRFMTLRLDAKDRSLWTADPVDIQTVEVQDDTGGTPITRWQVISAEEIEPGHVVKYDLQTLEFFGRFAFWMANDAPDYLDIFVDARDEPGVGFWSDDDGLMSNGDNGYKWQ